MYIKIFLRLLFPSLVVFVGMIESTSMAQSTKILFSRNQVGSMYGDICMLNLTDAVPQPIHSMLGYVRDIQLSDDGTKIAFSSNASTTGMFEIFIMNYGGSNLIQLTSNNDVYGSNYPVFQSSTKIWYDRGPVAGVHEWWEMNYDGSGQIKKTNWQASGKQSPRFNFTSDRTRVVYEKGNPSWSFSHDIFTANIDLTNEQQLTSNSIYDGSPIWSPDGSKIYWHQENAPWSGTFDIWVMNSNGTNPTKITNAPVGKKYMYPLISYDGSEVICSYHDGNQWDIYTMNLDGTSQQNITHTASLDEVAYHASCGTILPRAQFDIKYLDKDFPQEARTALEFAANNIWATYISSEIPISVHAKWKKINKKVEFMGQGKPTSFISEFQGVPLLHTDYAIALAEAISGRTLNGNGPDIRITFSEIPQIGFTWYFGTDGKVKNQFQYDFVTIALHELAHGLGFYSSFRINAGFGIWGESPFGLGIPLVYDRFVTNQSGQYLVNIYSSPSVFLASQLERANNYFDGPNTRRANDGHPVGLTNVNFGLDHLETTSELRLMEFSFPNGQAWHIPGDTTLAILRDIGWKQPNIIAPLVSQTIANNSVTTEKGDVSTEEVMPHSFALGQNYPNPFNPMTTITYQLPASCSVTLKMYNVLGREVSTLVNEAKPQGIYSVKWDGSGMPSGIYLYRLQAGTFTDTKRLLYLK